MKTSFQLSKILDTHLMKNSRRLAWLASAPDDDPRPLLKLRVSRMYWQNLPMVWSLCIGLIFTRSGIEPAEVGVGF